METMKKIDYTTINNTGFSLSITNVFSKILLLLFFAFIFYSNNSKGQVLSLTESIGGLMEITKSNLPTNDKGVRKIQDFKINNSLEIPVTHVPTSDRSNVVESQTDAPLAIRTASVSGNWSNTATWGGAAVPTSTEDVVINTTITVTVDIPNAQCKSLTMNRPGSGQSNNLNINAGGLTCAGLLDLKGTASNRINNIVITTGSLTISGDLGSASTSGCSISLTSSGTLNIGGNYQNFYPTLSTVSGCTINYNGNVAQSTIYPILMII